MKIKNAFKNVFTENLSKVIYDILISTGFSFALSLTLATASLFTPSAGVIFGYCVLTSITVRLLTHNKYTTGATFVLGAIILGILFFSLYKNDFLSDWFLRLQEASGHLIGSAMRKISYDSQYDIFLSAATPIAVSVLISIALRWDLGFYAVTVAGFFIIGIPAYRNWGSSPLGIVIFLGVLIVVLYGHFGILAIEGSGKEQRKATSGYVLSLVPLSLLIFLVAWILPKPQFQPINLLGIVTGSQNDSIAKEMTFASKGRPMGGISQQSNAPVMLVSASQPVYLSGMVYDTYSSDNWSLSEDGTGELFDKRGNVHAYHFYSSTEMQNQSILFDSLKEPLKSVKIEIIGASTKVIFVPAIEKTITPDFQESIFYNTAGEVWTKKAQKKGTTYTQTYYNYSHTNNEFQEYLREVSYGEWPRHSESLNRYLFYPESLPPRVAELTKEITKGLDNDYDRLGSIENYLKNFSYTLDPLVQPAGDDFIDFFLFESQEGYCVHYASAMTVMARTIGIPTRYVEGFVMPPSRGPDGKFLVTGKQAHAWVEAYFEDFGWVRFEPTPPNNDTLFDTSLLQLEEEPEVSPLEDPEEKINPLEEEPLDPLEKGKYLGATRILQIIFWLLLFVVAVGGVLYLFYYRVEKKMSRLKKLPGKEGTTAYFKGMLQVASRLKTPLDPKETMSMYARRLPDSSLPQEVREPLELGIPLFIKATYSDTEITQQEKNEMKEYYILVQEHMKKHERHIFVYYFHKYILQSY